jgi:hypothetical protein
MLGLKDRLADAMQAYEVRHLLAWVPFFALLDTASCTQVAIVFHADVLNIAIPPVLTCECSHEPHVMSDAQSVPRAQALLASVSACFAGSLLTHVAAVECKRKAGQAAINTC